MGDETPPCSLCGLPATGPSVEGVEFCCEGCRAVHFALDEVDNVERADLDHHAEPRDTSIPDTHDSTFLTVDGMYCSSCERFIQAVGESTDGVSRTQASYVTETVRVDHDPDTVSIDDLCDELSRLGYRAYPRGDADRQRRASNWAFGRLAAGVLIGMAVMLQYLVIIYPTYFGGWLYDDRTTAFFTEALASASGRYFFIVLAVLTTVVLLFTGKPILQGAYVSLRTRRPNMDLLIALAAMSAYLYSIVAIAVGRTDVYFDVTVMVILVVTVGGHYESTLKEKAIDQLADLTSITVDEATIITDEEQTTVSVDDLDAGDRCLVRAGERVPADGTVIDGTATVDESVITGESRPVGKTTGDTVVGGSLVVDGLITVTVDPEGGNSLDRITHLVWDLQSSNRGIQGIANRLATIFVPVVLVLALVITGVSLTLDATVASAILVGLTVLIVSCPCALGVATPLAIASGLRDALGRNIVVFDETVFERIRETQTVVFDKTGTLTTGDMELIESTVSPATLDAAAALESHVVHPIANAIAEVHHDGMSDAVPDGGKRLSQFPEPDSVDSLDTGVVGTVDGREIVVGHPDLIEERGIRVPSSIRSTFTDHRARGRVPVAVAVDGQIEGSIVVGDSMRQAWRSVFDALGDRNIDIVILTGDDERATTPFRAHDAVSDVFAGVPPEAKAETVARLTNRGAVTMVGDGTNDAPALANADLGIALGGGTAMAVDAADVAIVDDRLASIEQVFDLAEATGTRIRQNIGWGFCYNGIAIPLALAGMINPLLAALAMGTSSLLVVANSSRKLLSSHDEPASFSTD